jgi:hypothetical protein
MGQKYLLFIKLGILCQWFSLFFKKEDGAVHVVNKLENPFTLLGEEIDEQVAA